MSAMINTLPRFCLRAGLTSMAVGLILLFTLGVRLSGAQTATDPQSISDIAVPERFTRANSDLSSFALWLRQLPLRPDTALIHLYDGTIKGYQSARHRVLDLPIGNRDLQQCADAAIRLRSDYLYHSGLWNEIAFNFTSGDRAMFSRWIQGWRPEVSGNNVTWRQVADADSSRDAYLNYLEVVFTYAGSYSLQKETRRVRPLDNIQIGDCFIQGGFPGHVVIVVDMAIDTSSADKAILIAQGFTPAQDIHIIRNHRDTAFDPWYIVGKGERLVTPEWIFDWTDLRRFSD